MAFAVCILGGLSVGARAEVVIQRGLQAMIVFCLLGWVVGWAAEAVMYERVRKEAQEAAEKSRQYVQEIVADDDTTTVM
jgi:uncharacterized membrane protein YciS (DUF1049 family)